MSENTPLRRRRPGTRAVSPVIGAVLMLALALVLLAVLQSTAIPALNAQEEFRHNQEAQTDLVELESTVDRVAAVGTGETGTVAVGYRYPPRLLFINPPPVTGTLRTTDPGEVTVTNATTSGETGDYWTGGNRTFETTTLVYTPSYNEYEDAPVTVYEPWAVYNRDRGQTLALTPTDLVDGRRVSLVALNGDLSASGTGTESVELAPNSAPVKTVTVRNDTGPMRVTVPTELRRDEWVDLLDDEFDPAGTDPDAYVRAVDCQQAPPAPCGELTLTFEPGSYELALGEVAVGPDASREGPAYLTDVGGTGGSVAEGGRQRLVVEARDRFDNPVSGVSVSAVVENGPGSVRPAGAATGTDGRAAFVYEAPADVDSSGEVTVTARFSDGQQRAVSFDLRVVDLAGSGTGDGGNGSDGGGGTDGERTSASAVTGVAGSVDSRNIGGRNRGREASFSITAAEPVTVTGFSVTTRDDLEGRPFKDRGTTFDGGGLPVTVEGETVVALRDIDASADLGVSEFVDPTDPEADVIVVLEFADGSTKAIGIA
ncbi:type IV pilin [Salinirussus salinus]|uniref:type IV pilin n=1 Tax=Salinirussus salinus TaxID=1198300 RepID=UPI001356998B|nr:type IV pilin [Salinirussus salinus]